MKVKLVNLQKLASPSIKPVKITYKNKPNDNKDSKMQRKKHYKRTENNDFDLIGDIDNDWLATPDDFYDNI